MATTEKVAVPPTLAYTFAGCWVIVIVRPPTAREAVWLLTNTFPEDTCTRKIAPESPVPRVGVV